MTKIFKNIISLNTLVSGLENPGLQKNNNKTGSAVLCLKDFFLNSKPDEYKIKESNSFTIFSNIGPWNNYNYLSQEELDKTILKITSSKN